MLLDPRNALGTDVGHVLLARGHRHVLEVLHLHEALAGKGDFHVRVALAAEVGDDHVREHLVLVLVVTNLRLEVRFAERGKHAVTAFPVDETVKVVRVAGKLPDDARPTLPLGTDTAAELIEPHLVKEGARLERARLDHGERNADDDGVLLHHERFRGRLCCRHVLPLSCVRV